ncbi:ABC transporter permease [Biformimicrobium ophioploci]|uniref:ABC transporter permease n=1 Tax=Biformimicrobium ophioploci TaxID=3036711 RepID=A0ABQ6LY73_9GAMM|nr:ABC transporter permease [Microbulbifer sp. NKW57]GMG87047.1 ABC transporter permease [Microbulbifer sp. NKW57]
MTDLYLIYKNMTRKPLRLFLTCFAIFIAFLLYGAVTALKGALDSGVEMSADDRLVVVNRINFTNPLPISYVQKIRSVEGVEKVTFQNWFGGYYQDPKQQVVTFAAEPESYLDVYPELLVEPEQRQNWLRDRQGLLVGKAIAEQFGWKVGDKIPLNSNIFSHKDGGQTWDFNISGIYTGEDEQMDTRSAVFHYQYFRETNSWNTDSVGWIGLTTKDPALNEQVAKRIDEMFANSSAETDTSTEKAFNKAFIEQIGNIGLIIFGVVFMAFFTILVLVGNTMALAVRERTGEIAVLKTLGFNASRIFRMVLAESMLVTLLGGLAGLGTAYLLIEGAKAAMARFLPGLVMTPEIAVQAVGYMLALGLITGLLPAFKAMRLNLATAFARG